MGLNEDAFSSEHTCIGVIGGAGVAATNTLLHLVEEHHTRAGALRDAHHPEMIIWQATRAPSRSLFFEGRGPSFINDYITIGARLRRMGAQRLCMCCNTAHAAFDEIASAVGIPFINVIEEVVSAAGRRNKRRIGLIASDGCLASKIYEKSFAALFPEAELIYPAADLQRAVTRGICAVKSRARFLPDDDPERPKNIFRGIVDDLKRQGCETIIVGCTDIRVDFTSPDCIDSLEILAQAIIHAADSLVPCHT